MANLERIDQTIEGNDLFIASHARALDLTLITANVSVFSRVPNLRIENWLDASEKVYICLAKLNTKGVPERLFTERLQQRNHWPMPIGN